MQRKAAERVFQVVRVCPDCRGVSASLPADIDKVFQAAIDRMDEDVIHFEPLLDEGIPVVREC